MIPATSLSTAQAVPHRVPLSIKNKPTFFSDLIDAVSNGELFIDFCKNQGVKYSEAMGYVLADDNRKAAWNAAVKDGQSVLVNTLISELRAISTIDVKDMFENDGSLRPIDDIPFALRRVIAGIEVAEIWEGEGRDRKVVGVLKKVKLTDKLKAIEMLGKQLNMFVNKVVVSGTVEVKHHVEKYDLEERIQMLRAGKPLPLAVQAAMPVDVPHENIEDALIIEKGTISQRPGEDI